MMKKIQDYSLIAVFVMTAILAAVAGLKAYSGYMKNRAEEEALFQQRKEEILARNAEAQNRVQEMQVEIIELQSDVEALQTFIDDAVNAANEVQSRKAVGNISGNGDASSADAASGDSVPAQSDSVSGSDVSGQPGSVSGNDMSGQPDSVSGNEGSVSENDGSGFGESVSGNEGDFEGSVSGNDEWSVSGNSVSGNGDMTISGNMSGSVSENDADEDNAADHMTLEERRQWRTSYQETMEVNQTDREWIAENQYDFSQMKIACLGDSITKAANLEDEENYEQYAYPARLQELLGAEEVYNLGIGGSSIGRYWADAFVDRYTEIPQDSDIIIVMGGTNDGFCVSDEEFGSLDEREYHTFCGDLDELMGGLRENYPDAQIFFATPLPNVLQDYLMSEREYLLPQKDFVEVIQVLADEYDFELIDLYNSNVLDSHDANIITEYMPDGVHGNPAGYQILAEHFAGELVRYYNEDDSESEEENTASDGNATGNGGVGVGTNTGAGVGGNAGAGAGVITIVGGNGEAEAEENETDGENQEDLNDTEDDNTETDEEEEDGILDDGTDTGEDDGADDGTGEDGDGENGNSVESGIDDADAGRNAGSDTGTDEKDSDGSERKKRRYEY